MVDLSKLTNKPDIICAIDASTNNIAFAIFDGKELKKIGKINFSGHTVYDKISDACRKTQAVFDLFEIQAVVIEHTVFINSPKTAADLALVQGGILGGMSLSGVTKIKSINPIAWQTYLGNGRLTTEEKSIIRSDNPNKSASWYKNKEREFRKERTIRFINTFYDVEISDNDIADAVGIGHYAINNWSRLN